MATPANYPTAGGSRVRYNVSAPTVIKASPGEVFKVFINTIPTAAGGIYNTSSTTAGEVVQINMTKVGSGYITTPNITFSAPGAGTTATGTAVMSQGSVVDITITNPGSGYTSAPTITIDASPSGNDATATAVISAMDATTLLCAIPAGTVGPLTCDAPMTTGIVVDPGTAGVVCVSYT